MRWPALVLLAAVTLTGCDGPDAMRRQFVALRYLQSAEARLTALPRDVPRAVAELDRALALLPNDEGLRERAAFAYVAARAYDRALPLLREQVLADHPEPVRRRYQIMLAQYLLRSNNKQEGIAICRAVIAEAGQLRRAGKMGAFEFALTLNDAGYVLADAGVELERARKAIEAAVELQPLEAAFLDSLGWVLYQQGEYRDAAFYLERAVRLRERDDAEMLYHLGAALARIWRLADAERLLRRAQWADPSWPVIEEELRRLRRNILLPMIPI